MNTPNVQYLNECIDLGERVYPKFKQSWIKAVDYYLESEPITKFDKWEYGRTLSICVGFLWNAIDEEPGGVFDKQQWERLIDTPVQVRLERIEKSYIEIVESLKPEQLIKILVDQLIIGFMLAKKECLNKELKSL